MPSPFARSASRLIENGFSPIPIAPRIEPTSDRSKPPTGKEPGRFDAEASTWFRLRGWNLFCDRQAHLKIVKYWSSWPDVGLGIACGFGGLVAVDIDDDALIEPIRAVLPDAIVGKRGRKGATYFFRSSDPLPSKNYRTADARGLLDFLSGGKQTVIPPTAHPSGGNYRWITERTLLDTPLAELPEITGAHVAAMENILRAHGWDDPAPRQPRGEAIERSAVPPRSVMGDRDFDRAVRDARARWLPLLRLEDLRRVSGGWRSVVSFRPSGPGKRDLNLSIRDNGPIVDHVTGNGYNDATLVAACLKIPTAEAFAWLREQIGWTEPVAAPVVAPTYHDNRVNLGEATARLQAITGPDLDAAIQSGIFTRNQVAINPPLILPVHPVTIVRSEAGIGKTHAAIKGSAEQAKRGRHIVYVVPRHDLAAQIAAGFVALGVNAEVYRGFEQPDPLSPDVAMCRNIPAYTAARDLGVGIREAVCERRVEGEAIRCPLSSVCGMERQRGMRPQVWVIPAALLYMKRADFIFLPDAIVIDEAFIDGAIGDTVQIDVPALIAARIEGCSDDDRDAVMRYRTRLAAALAANGDGPLSRAALIESGIDTEDANWVGWLEQRRITSSVLRPNMRESELRTAAKRHAAANTLARAAGTLWHEIATFLEEWKIEATIGDRELSGRIAVVGGKLSVKPLRTVHPSWDVAPMLILDATAPPPSLLRSALDGFDDGGVLRDVIEEPDVAAKWPDHVRVRQIMGGKDSKNKLGLWDGPKGGPRPRNVRDVVRFIRLQAALAAPARIGIISFKGLLDQIEGRLPANVAVRHFGALAGMNDMEDVVGLIVIGRPAPKRSDVEASASVFAGRPVPSGEGHRFDQRPGGIQLADGSIVSTEMDHHPEPFAEALRWRITEGELLQAIGRLRPHRRSEPCWLDIVCEVPLPIRVHEVVRWGDVAPGAEADMAHKAGVILTNSRDAMAAFGLSKHDAEEVGGCPETLIKTLIRIPGQPPPVRTFTYRKAGPGQKTNTGYYLPGVMPGGVATLRAWLEDRLGPVASLEVEQLRVKDSPEAQTMLAKIGRETQGRFRFKNVLEPTMRSIEAFFASLDDQDG